MCDIDETSTSPIPPQIPPHPLQPLQPSNTIDSITSSTSQSQNAIDEFLGVSEEDRDIVQMSMEQIPPPIQLLNHHQIHLQQHQQQFISAEELAMENYWLREKLKDITTDRDRLLCEVANLRMEMDMAELKRLPGDDR